jgi:hypothetical protein
VEKIKAKSLFLRTALGLALGCTALAGSACGGDDKPPGGDTPPDGGDGTCGGLLGTVCPAGKYCDYEAGSCGHGDVLGTCRAIPDTCTQECTTVCGCNGLAYCNACMAHLDGVDDSAETTCVGAPLN